MDSVVADFPAWDGDLGEDFEPVGIVEEAVVSGNGSSEEAETDIFLSLDKIFY
jgi:hypothetical protein